MKSFTRYLRESTTVHVCRERTPTTQCGLPCGPNDISTQEAQQILIQARLNDKTAIAPAGNEMCLDCRRYFEYRQD